jgi:hypothetical protein
VGPHVGEGFRQYLIRGASRARIKVAQNNQGDILRHGFDPFTKASGLFQAFACSKPEMCVYNVNISGAGFDLGPHGCPLFAAYESGAPAWQFAASPQGDGETRKDCVPIVFIQLDHGGMKPGNITQMFRDQARLIHTLGSAPSKIELLNPYDVGGKPLDKFGHAAFRTAEIQSDTAMNIISHYSNPHAFTDPCVLLETSRA